MSHPQYNPYSSGNQSSSQGQSGLSNSQANSDPQDASSFLGPGSSFSSSRPSSAFPANSGQTFSPLVLLYSLQPEPSRVATADDTNMNASRAREEGQCPFTSAQPEEFCSSGTEMSSHPTSSASASRSSSGESGDLQASPGLGGHDNPVSAKPAASSQLSHNSEAAVGILKRFGLEREDLKHLLSYPKDQITPSNLPFILRKIHLEKEKQKKASAAAGQSKPNNGPLPTRIVSGVYRGRLNSPGWAGMLQEKTTTSVVKPAKVIDYGHISNKCTAGVSDEIRSTSDKDGSSGPGGLMTMDSAANRYPQEPLQIDPAEFKSSVVGYSHDQGSSSTSLSSLSSVQTSAASPSSDKIKKWQAQPNQTLQSILSPFCLQKEDTDTGIFMPEASKPDFQSTLKPQTPATSFHSVRPSRPVLLLTDCDGNSSTKYRRVQPVQKTHGLQQERMPRQSKVQQVQPTHQPISYPFLHIGQPMSLAALGNPVPPIGVFPSTTVWPTANAQPKEWLSNQNTNFQLESSTLLQKQTADKDSKPSTSTATQKSRPGSRSPFKSPDCHRLHGLESKRDKRRSRSRSPQRSRYSRRSPERRSSAKWKDMRQSASRKGRNMYVSPPRRSYESRRVHDWLPPRRGHERWVSPRRVDKKLWPLRTKGATKMKTKSRSPPGRSRERTSSREGSSPQRSNSAEVLAKKIMERPAAQLLSNETDLETMVRTLAPAILAELVRISSSSTSSSFEKGKSSASAGKKSSSVVPVETDVTEVQMKTPLTKPAASSVSEHRTATSTMVSTTKKAIASPDITLLTGTLPCGAKKSTASKQIIQRRKTLNKARVLVSKAKSFSHVKQLSKTMRTKVPAKGAVKKALKKQKTNSESRSMYPENQPEAGDSGVNPFPEKSEASVTAVESEAEMESLTEKAETDEKVDETASEIETQLMETSVKALIMDQANLERAADGIEGPGVGALNLLDETETQVDSLAESDSNVAKDSSKSVGESSTVSPEDPSSGPTVGEMLQSCLFPNLIYCWPFNPHTSSGIPRCYNNLLISRLPVYFNGNYTEGDIAELLAPYGFKSRDRLYVLPQSRMAFAMMGNRGNVSRLLRVSYFHGIYLKGERICIEVMSMRFSLPPLKFYTFLTSVLNCTEYDEEERTIFIRNISQTAILKLRHSLKYFGPVKNFMPLLNKLFVEFETVEDADRFGDWYRNHELDGGEEVIRLKNNPNSTNRLQRPVTAVTKKSGAAAVKDTTNSAENTSAVDNNGPSSQDVTSTLNIKMAEENLPAGEGSPKEGVAEVATVPSETETSEYQPQVNNSKPAPLPDKPETSVKGPGLSLTQTIQDVKPGDKIVTELERLLVEEMVLADEKPKTAPTNVAEKEAFTTNKAIGRNKTVPSKTEASENQGDVGNFTPGLLGSAEVQSRSADSQNQPQGKRNEKLRTEDKAESSADGQPPASAVETQQTEISNKKASTNVLSESESTAQAPETRIAESHEEQQAVEGPNEAAVELVMPDPATTTWTMDSPPAVGEASTEAHLSVNTNPAAAACGNFSEDFCLTVGEMLETHFYPDLLCSGASKDYTRHPDMKQLLISELPIHDDDNYTENKFAKMLARFGFKNKEEKLYVIPQSRMAIAMMPTRFNMLQVMNASEQRGIYFRGKRLAVRVIRMCDTLNPLHFYTFLKTKMNCAVKGDVERTCFIRDISQTETRQLREALNDFGSVTNFVPLLNKLFVEFESVEDANRFGDWYRLFNGRGGDKVVQLSQHAPLAPKLQMPTSKTLLTPGEAIEKYLDRKTLGSYICTNGTSTKLLISSLPLYGDGSYTEDDIIQLLTPFGYQHMDKNIYIVPQAQVAFVQMPSEGSVCAVIKAAKKRPIILKGSKLWFRAVKQGFSLKPLMFYQSLMKMSGSGEIDRDRLIFIRNISAAEIKELRVIFKKIGAVFNFLPLLNKVFVEFNTGPDADRLGVWYSLLKNNPGYIIQRVGIPISSYSPSPKCPEKALPDSEDLIDGATIPVRVGVPHGSASPFWISLRKNPFVFPTICPWFIIPEHQTVKSARDIERASERGSMCPTIMLTGLPEGNYKQDEVANLVWPYFPLRNNHSLYYNIMVLPLQRRAFVFFPDWSTCCNFAQDHIKNPHYLRGNILSVHFVLQHMYPESTEEMMYRSLMKWSNAGVPDLNALDERLLIVEISDVTVNLITLVVEMVASITRVVNFLPLANRICIEMADSNSVRKVAAKYNQSPNSFTRDPDWRKVTRVEPLRSLKRRLQHSDEAPITLKVGALSVENESPEIDENLLKAIEVTSGQQKLVQERRPQSKKKVQDSFTDDNIPSDAFLFDDGFVTIDSYRSSSEHSSRESRKKQSSGGSSAQRTSSRSHKDHKRSASSSSSSSRSSEVSRSSHSSSVSKNVTKRTTSPTKPSSSSSARKASSSSQVFIDSSSSSSCRTMQSSRKSPVRSSDAASAGRTSLSSPVYEREKNNAETVASSAKTGPKQLGDEAGSTQSGLVRSVEGAKKKTDELGTTSEDDKADIESGRFKVLDSSNDQTAEPMEDVGQGGSSETKISPSRGQLMDRTEDEDPDQDLPFQGDTLRPECEGPEQEVFEILDSIDEQTEAEDVSQKPDTLSIQISKEDKRPIKEEDPDMYLVVDSLEDQSMKTEAEAATDKVAIRNKNRETNSSKCGRPARQSDTKSRQSMSDKKQLSPRKEHRMVKRYETRAKMDTTADKEATEEIIFEIIDTDEENPVGTAIAEQSGRRSTRAKKEDKAKPKSSEKPEEASYVIIGSLESETTQDEPTVTRRSTGGRVGIIVKDEKTVKEDTQARKRQTPARESESREKIPPKEATPAKRSEDAIEIDEEDATYEIFKEDAVEDVQRRAKRRRGRPKKEVKTTKKGSVPSNKDVIVVDDEDEIFQSLDSVEDKEEHLNPSDEPGSSSHDETLKSTSAAGTTKNTEEEGEKNIFRITDLLVDDPDQEKKTGIEKEDKQTCGATVFGAEEGLHDVEKVHDPESSVEACGQCEKESEIFKEQTSPVKSTSKEKQFEEEPRRTREERKRRSQTSNGRGQGDGEGTGRGQKRVRKDENTELDTQELVTPVETGAGEAEDGKESAGQKLEGETREVTTLDELVKEELEAKTKQSKRESHPLSQDDDDLDQETLVTSDETGYDAEDEPDKEQAETTLRSGKRKQDDHTEERGNVVILHKEKGEASTPRPRGRPRKKTRKFPAVRKRRKAPVAPEAKRPRSESPPMPDDQSQDFMVAGFFCHLCNVFYPDENDKELHGSSQKHHDNLQKHYQTLQQESS